ncbi:hypothetical protein FGB62_243g024 [Gracilaria domingensis]|nr:hypothetical protein FGB62_243g024 [Gracilaria domingensis]
MFSITVTVVGNRHSNVDELSKEESMSNASLRDTQALDGTVRTWQATALQRARRSVRRRREGCYADSTGRKERLDVLAPVAEMPTPNAGRRTG